MIMTIGDLKEMIKDLPDDMDVMVPLNAGAGFDGIFFSPCLNQSGEAEFGTEYLDEEEIREAELLNKPLPAQKSFALVPCGFFDQRKDVCTDLN
jgi:hypothetical protein